MTKIFKILCPVLILAYGMELFSTVQMINFSDIYQKVFCISLVGSIVLSHIFVKTHGYLAVLLHELTHNFWGVLTFNKPVGLSVQANQGGKFVFQGRHNIMSVLSPYFFPMLTVLFLPFYFLLATSGAAVYFGILGATLGLSFSISIRQCKPHQPDLHVYGVGASYMMVLFFQILFLGLILSFVVGRMPMLVSFVKSGYYNIVFLYDLILSLIPRANV